MVSPPNKDNNPPPSIFTFFSYCPLLNKLFFPICSEGKTSSPKRSVQICQPNNLNSKKNLCENGNLFDILKISLVGYYNKIQRAF